MITPHVHAFATDVEMPCLMLQIEGLMENRSVLHYIEDVESLLMCYQLLQREMESNASTLSDAWWLQHQMEEILVQCTSSPASELEVVRDLWKETVHHAQRRSHALCVLLDPRIWELERIGKLELPQEIIDRATNAFDHLCMRYVPNEKKTEVRAP